MKRKLNLSNPDSELETLSKNHSTALEYLYFVGSENWNDYFKFGFVRNPWDRLVSIFHYYLNGGNGDKIDYLIQKEMPSRFSDFINNIDYFENKLIIPEWEYRIFRHLKPQYTFLFDDSHNNLVDFIGRFENLSPDFKKVLKIIDYKSQPTLSHMRKSDHDRYQSYYDRTSKKIVEEKYHLDIKKFHYTF